MDRPNPVFSYGFQSVLPLFCLFKTLIHLFLNSALLNMLGYAQCSLLVYSLYQSRYARNRFWCYCTFVLLFLLMIQHEETWINPNRNCNPNPKLTAKVQWCPDFLSPVL